MHKKMKYINIIVSELKGNKHYRIYKVDFNRDEVVLMHRPGPVDMNLVCRLLKLTDNNIGIRTIAKEA